MVLRPRTGLLSMYVEVCRRFLRSFKGEQGGLHLQAHVCEQKKIGNGKKSFHLTIEAVCRWLGWVK